MSPFEVQPVRAASAIDSRIARETHGQAGGRERPSEIPKQPVVTIEPHKAGEAPIDSERVEVIRKAVESGTYPVLPARIADAVIAAGMLLRSGE